MGILSKFNPFDDEFDPGRAGLAIATGGLSEAGGARQATEALGAGDPIGDVAAPVLDPLESAAKPVGDVVGGLGSVGGLFDTPSSNFQAQGAPVDTFLSDASKSVFGQNFTAPQAQAAGINTTGFDAGIAAQGQSRAVQAGLAGAGGGLLSGADPRAAQQGRAVGLLEQAALGQAPSAAQIQQQQGLEDAMRSQLSLAASARGGPGAQIAAQRQAARNTADLQQRAVGQQAALRAQEMAAARGGFATAAGQQTGQVADTLFGLGQLATQARGQDIDVAGLAGDLAGQQAQLEQQTALANQDAQLAAMGLGLESQLGGLSALTAEQQLQQDAILDPQRIMADIERARLAGEFERQNALIGGIAGAASAGLASALTPTGK